MLNISTDRPLRSPRQLLDLAEAIRDAGEHDENDWIEWKSSYDLTKKEVKATIARHIIGMANRTPEKAFTMCQGYGYIVIGVEPDNVEGVASIDLADLDSGLQAYLGHQGPEWSASYVTLDGKTVLVLTVEPPAMGDRIHTLHKEFGNYVPGMIFSRRAGRTLQANPGEVLSLTRRAAAQGIASQSMVITSETEVTEIPLWELNEYIEEQIARRKGILQSRGVQRPAIGISSIDGRTEEDYWDEVRKYLDRCREHLGKLARKAYVQNGFGGVRLTISNADQISHQGVRVELTFPNWLTAIIAEEYEDARFLEPRFPEPLGNGISGIVNSNEMQIINAAYLGPREMETSVEDGLVVFNVASVRAEGKVRLPKIHLIAESWADGERVEVAWAITALNSGGRVKGSLQLTQKGRVTVGHQVEQPNKAVDMSGNG